MLDYIGKVKVAITMRDKYFGGYVTYHVSEYELK